jgi:hypothetical protein
MYKELYSISNKNMFMCKKRNRKWLSHCSSVSGSYKTGTIGHVPDWQDFTREYFEKRLMQNIKKFPTTQITLIKFLFKMKKIIGSAVNFTCRYLRNYLMEYMKLTSVKKSTNYRTEHNCLRNFFYLIAWIYFKVFDPVNHNFPRSFRMVCFFCSILNHSLISSVYY